jgi:hypothetical protein
LLLTCLSWNLEVLENLSLQALLRVLELAQESELYHASANSSVIMQKKCQCNRQSWIYNFISF